MNSPDTPNRKIRSSREIASSAARATRLEIRESNCSSSLATTISVIFFYEWPRARLFCTCTFERDDHRNAVEMRMRYCALLVLPPVYVLRMQTNAYAILENKGQILRDRLFLRMCEWRHDHVVSLDQPRRRLVLDLVSTCVISWKAHYLIFYLSLEIKLFYYWILDPVWRTRRRCESCIIF